MGPSCGGYRRLVQKLIDLVHLHNRNDEGATAAGNSQLRFPLIEPRESIENDRVEPRECIENDRDEY